MSYYLCSTFIKATTCFYLPLKQINKLLSYEVHVKSIICDQVPNNRSIITKLGLKKETQWIEVDGNKIFSVYDVSHLMKNIRNILLKSEIMFKKKSTFLRHKRNIYN